MNSMPREAAPVVPTAAASAGRDVRLAAIAGLLAGLLAWSAGELTVKAFRPPMHVQNVMGQTIERATFEDRAAADAKNATLAYTEFGLLLGVGLGAAGGLIGRASRQAVRGAAAGGALGAVFSFGAALVLLPVYFRAEDTSQAELSRDLTLPLLIHVGCWSATGLAAGVAYGIGRGGGSSRLAGAALGGALGGALGAALYEVVCATAMPHSGSTTPLPWSMTARLVARVLVAVSAGSLAALVADTPLSRSATKRRRAGTICSWTR